MLTLVAGCEAPPKSSGTIWITDGDVTASGKPGSSPVRVDVCLDATPSMSGFATDSKSTYVTLLDELEGVVQNRLSDAQVRYFKFGELIRRVSREEFRSAKTLSFYNEPGIFRTTNVENVFRRDEKLDGSSASHLPTSQEKPSPSATIAIVVTDLFQHDSDLNLLVQQIKGNCFASGCSLGVLPVASEFDGTVYDARVGSFRYQSTPDAPATHRPFYLLFFGDQDRIEELVGLMASKPYIDASRFLLISPKTVRRFAVDLKKDRESKDLNLAGGASYPDGPLFKLRKGGRGGILHAEVRYEQIPGAPALDPSRVTLEVLEGGRNEPGKPSDRITLMKSTAPGNGAITADLALDLPGAAGDYRFQLVFRSGGQGSLATPSWVGELSSDNPRPEKDPQKTLNLKHLVDELIGASLSVQSPPVARAFLTVKKLD